MKKKQDPWDLVMRDIAKSWKKQPNIDRMIGLELAYQIVKKHMPKAKRKE
jgi:hypothetical protein